MLNEIVGGLMNDYYLAAAGVLFLYMITFIALEDKPSRVISRKYKNWRN